jgi:hypothetical protein
MEIMIRNKENVELSLPVNSAYINAARQTAFSVAGRLGFDAQEAYDIKTAVSEACEYLIRRLKDGAARAYKIVFEVFDDYMNIHMSCPSNLIKKPDSHALADIPNFSRIRRLMDYAEIKDDGEFISIVMSKRYND